MLKLNKSTGEKIDRSLIADQVYRILKRNILDGKLLPNTRLIELHLAEAFNLSRAPIREALANLEHSGLVYRRKQYRYVQEITDKHIIENYQAWQMVEGFGGQIACKDSKKKDIEQLENIYNLMEHNINNLSEYRGLNYKFHKYLIIPCHNTIIKKYHTQILTHVQWVMNITISDILDPKISICEHKNILDAFKEKDILALEKNIRSHIGGALERARNRYS